ncbi:MAG: cyclic pyranopterin monophosphate synthase MoaC [Candidatus Cyclobacteriaceae bacterium M2_1C_046]
MGNELSHVDKKGNPTMVDVGDKMVTRRIAIAQSIIDPPSLLLDLLENNEIYTKKGPVFHTAIIAGTMAAKKTADLIPFCHPLPMDSCKIDIKIEEKQIYIVAEVSVTAKTGVEMEALTAASVAALTVYDMCKAVAPGMIIKETKLLTKTGGKKDYYVT